MFTNNTETMKKTETTASVNIIGLEQRLRETLFQNQT